MKRLSLITLIVCFLILISPSVISKAYYCNIRQLDISDDLTLGESDGALLLSVEQKRTELDNTTQFNYSVNHASCYINIYERKKVKVGQDVNIVYDIVSTEPYENIIPHGLRYSTTGGVLNFLMDMNEEFWKPNTNYTWQAYCYCLPYNQTNGPQDQHDCWYGVARGPGGYSGIEDYSSLPINYYLGCINKGNFTTNRDFRVTDRGTSSTSLAITIFILLISGIIMLLPLLFDYLLRRPFVPNKLLNLILRRCCYLIGVYLLILDSTIMASLAHAAGIPLQNEMWFFMRFFGIAAYLIIIYILFQTLIDLLKSWNIISDNKKYGTNRNRDEDGDYADEDDGYDEDI